MNEHSSTTEQEHILKVITEKEAANLFGISARTLQNLRQTGGGPKFIKLSARRVGYRIKDLDEWISKRAYTSTKEPPVECPDTKLH